MEYVELGKLCNIKTGKLDANKSDENGIYPFFTCNEKPLKINEYAFDTSAILISGNGSKVGHVNHYEGKFNAYQRTYVLDNFKDIEKKYLYYVLKNDLKEYIKKNSKKASIPYITFPMLQEIKIPLPPLKIQKDISKKLDKFTEYIDLLNEELRLRRKQYEYYRDELLNFGDDITKVNITMICDVKDGTHDSPKKTNEGKLLITSKNITKGYLDLSDAYYISEQDYNKINLRSKVSKNDILVSMIGTIGQILYVSEEPDYAIKNMGLIKVSDKINAKFLYYYLKSNHIKKELLKNIKRGTQVFLALKDLRNLKIPMPSLSKQQEIVNILDKFELLCNENLPYKISLKEKQYKYYREKLLSFS